ELGVEFISSKADPYRVPMDHPGNQAAAKVLKQLYGREPLAVYMGGTIPVCGILKSALGAYTINFSFALDDENVHSPNEFFRLTSFRRGQKGYGLILQELADLRFSG
ncbi:MAG: hypothetical protein WBG37_06355, partial [Desulfobacterales bacterium]